MRSFNLVLLALFSTTMASAFSVYTEMHDGRRRDVVNWEEFALQEDHSGYPMHQPHRQWKNYTYDIPWGAKTIQFTVLDRYNTTYDNDGAHSADIPYFAIDKRNRKLHISYMWWGVPWSIYLGFGY